MASASPAQRDGAGVSARARCLGDPAEVPASPRPIKFKHFCRKGYALFACLGKEVLIGTLSVSMLAHAKADGISVEVLKASGSIQNSRQQAVTEEDGATVPDTGLEALERHGEDSRAGDVQRDSVPAGTVMLGEVGVTGSRVPMPGQAAVRMVTVLGADAIGAKPAQSVNDVLKDLPGVDVRQRGALGAQTDIGIRGGTSEHVALLLNGVNVCDPQTAHNGLDLPVDVSEVERIVVTEGPAARAYGASSLSGAVNVLTGWREGSGLTVHAEGGSFGYFSGGARVAFVEGAWANALSAGYSRSDGHSRSKAGALNSDFDAVRAFYQGRFDCPWIQVSWHAGMSLKGWGSNTFYSVLSDEQYERTQKYYTAIKAETKKGAVRLSPTVYWNRFHDRYEFYRGMPDRSAYNYNRTDILGASLSAYVDWFLGRTVASAELRSERLRSGNLGEPLDAAIPIRGTDREYTLGLERTNLGLCLEHNLSLGGFDASLGLVAIKNTWSDMPLKVYPGIDLSYSPLRGLRLFASFNSSLRMPSYTELYYSVDGHKADKHLRPEEMSALEVGARYRRDAFRAGVSLFRHWGRNMIDWIMDMSLGEDAVWESVNHASVNSIGAEASFGLDFSRLFPSQRVLGELSLSYAYTDQSQEREEGIQSLYALEYLRHKLVASLDLGIVRNLGLRLSCRYQDREGSYADADAVVHDYRPYFVMDARLSYDRPRYAVYAEANNILGTRYVDYGNVPQPGAWITVGARYRLGF